MLLSLVLSAMVVSKLNSLVASLFQRSTPSTLVTKSSFQQISFRWHNQCAMSAVTSVTLPLSTLPCEIRKVTNFHSVSTLGYSTARFAIRKVSSTAQVETLFIISASSMILRPQWIHFVAEPLRLPIASK